MEFEYNIGKAEANKKKHGVDFEEAKVLWEVDNVILPAITKGEERRMIIGRIKEDLHSCIFTIRSKKIRIISCRKSRDKEKEIYHEKVK
ncbi:MAG: BrnT family toxin [Candidatus Omnitrophica bacterium]|nr:BrnT family toxin [Candidatus Omnitrophota bacterium]MBU4457940.1 BrnT family toxin [Candidatus Omnitrophota bacterium]